jgi:hypothetical protein
MRRLAVLSVVWLVAASAAVTADVHIYNKVGGGWKKVGRMKSDGGVAFVCNGGDCDYTTICGPCHAGGSAKPLPPGAEFRNLPIHETAFRSRALMVAGQPLPWGASTLKREGGRLTISESSGRRLASLPADAMVLPDRTGRAAFVVYKGDLSPTP